MDLETFNKLKRIANSEIKITEDNAHEQVYRSSEYYQKYLDIYSKESLVLEEMKSNLDREYAKWLKHFKYDDKYEWTAQYELNAMIYGQDEYIKISQALNLQKIIVDYLKKLLDNISKMNYAIREYREFKAFLSGKNY